MCVHFFCDLVCMLPPCVYVCVMMHKMHNNNCLALSDIIAQTTNKTLLLQNPRIKKKIKIIIIFVVTEKLCALCTFSMHVLQINLQKYLDLAHTTLKHKTKKKTCFSRVFFFFSSLLQLFCDFFFLFLLIAIPN